MRSPEIGTPLRLLALFALITLSVLLACASLTDAKRADTEGENSDWLYRREGSSTSTNEKDVQIILVGDIMPARTTIVADDPFNGVSQILSAADMAIGNLEGVIVPPELRNYCLSLSGPPAGYRILIPLEAVKTIQTAGFDLLGLANNHVQDCGEIGLNAMSAVLERAGIHTAGTMHGAAGGYQPAILTVRGLRIAVLPFSAIHQHAGPMKSDSMISDIQPAAWEPDQAVLAIRQARTEADFVILWLHWGEEYNLQANLWQRETARTLVDAGAELVIGHHPHVVQETQVIQRPGGNGGIGFVAYSLGNFMFDQYEPISSQGLALRVLIDELGLKAVQALPVKSNLQPGWLDQAASRDLIGRIQPDPRRTGFACDEVTCHLVEVDPNGVEGIFTHGSIDLTGDGRAEKIWLNEGRIYIYSDNQLAWTSPQEWKVIDLALGDPNEDGRYEILAAVNGKRDGVMTSQPFILGYRGGIYRQLWGGSPVSEAILEVEVGDVDSDGSQELVVIEAGNHGKHALAVWDWHGWGFSLSWRSPEDFYTDLVVQETAEGSMVINVGLAW